MRLIDKTWAEWLEENYGTKKETFGTRVRDCAVDTVTQLQQDYGWGETNVILAKTRLFVSFTWEGRLYSLWIPLSLVAKTLNVSKYIKESAIAAMEDPQRTTIQYTLPVGFRQQGSDVS